MVDYLNYQGLCHAQGRYIAQTSGKQPAELDFEDLDAGIISGFLTHLEKQRGVSVSTRNARLVALRSWFAFAAHRHPEHAALIARVLAIPSKRRDRPLVSFLEPDEADALLKAPATGRWTGRRDRVLLTFAVQTGLRVSELTAVRNADIALGRGAHVQVLGKGWISRSVRAGVPLWREPPCRGGVSHHDAAGCAVAPPRVCCWCDCSSGSCRWDADVTKGVPFDGRLQADPSVAR